MRSTHPGRRSFTCCNVRIDAMDLHEASDRILECARDGTARSIFLCNAYNLSLASRDLEYREILNRGWLNLADGWPVRAVAAVGFGSRIAEPPCGSELLVRVWDEGLASGVKHAFLGSDASVLSQLDLALGARGDRAGCISVMDPLVSSSLIADLVDSAELALRDHQPDVVWIGLGTPKQDQFIDALQDRVPGVYVAVGAAFDFVSGNKRRAPLLLRRMGLEWLHRLVTEPRRLWRRYLVGSARFVLGLLTQPPHLVTPIMDVNAKESGRKGANM